MGVWDISHEPLRFTVTAEQRERLAYSTGRIEYFGHYQRVIPELTRADFADIKFAGLPPCTGYESLFAGFFQPASYAWDQYFLTRKIVERPLDGGGVKVSVASNLHEVLSAEHHLAQPLVETLEHGKGRSRVRTYQLAQVLTDTYLVDSMNMEPKLFNTVRSLALSRPDLAAAKVQEWVRRLPGKENVVVTAGKYSRSKNWAKDSVRAYSEQFPVLTVASDAAVVGDRLFMYGPNGLKSWSVSGPVWRGGEIANVHKMVVSAGTSSVMFALGAELTILDIDIFDGNKFESPSITYHSGSDLDLPMGSSVSTKELLSPTGVEKIMSLRQGMQELTVDGVKVATAIRVTPKYALVSAHVVSEGAEIRIGGVDARPIKAVSRDLWVYSAYDDLPSTWSIRDALVGESVIACYLREGELQFTSPLSIRSTDGVTLIMSNLTELQPGMSGAAIVALSDLAFLGVYNGIGSRTAMASAFSPDNFADICSIEHASSVSRSDATDVEGALYSRLKSRGLGNLLDSSIASLEPIYAGDEHIGMGYYHSGIFRTTCDVDTVPVRVGEKSDATVRKFMQFDRVAGAMCAAVDKSDDHRCPMIYRKPSYGEKVFVMGVDSVGPYYTSVDASVIHVGLGSKNFTISSVSGELEFPMTGGLVVAVRDAAVLGQYVGAVASAALGQGGYCLSLYDVSIAEAKHDSDPVEFLQHRFPMLHVSVWDKQLIEEVFTHSSAQSYPDGRTFNSGNNPMGYIGDAALKIAFGLSLREAEVPYTQWQQHFQRLQTDSHMSSIAHKLGLHRYLRVGHGAVLQPDSKPFATLLEALVAAVYLSETTDVFNQFCLAIDMIQGSYELDLQK